MAGLTNTHLINLKAASSMAGVSPHRLRAWERRYKVITPKRDPAGRRVYASDEVEKLKLLSELTGAGHSIGSISRLNLHDLKKLNLRSPSPAKDFKSSASHPVNELIAAVKGLEVERLERELLKLRLNTPLTPLVLEVFSPLFQEIGRLVSRKKMGIAQEHLLSAALRNHLGELLATVQKTFDWNRAEECPLPRLIFTTPEGDLHEFGILLAALLAGNHGFKFRYLGPNMPAEDFANAVQKSGADVIVVGCSKGAVGNLEAFLNKLSRAQPKLQSVWIGGIEREELKDFSGSGIDASFFVSLSDFQKKLASLLKLRGRAEKC